MDFWPTATLTTLRNRARFLGAIREFFDRHGYWEVDTPLLSHDQVIDANLEPLVVADGWRGHPLYLQTSPEFAMKRLLVAGATAIYQLGKVFRKDERGSRHNPEFTMLEWYRVGDDHHQQMSVTEALVRQMFRRFSEVPLSDSPFLRTSYQTAFERVGVDEIHTKSVSDLADFARNRGLIPPPGLDTTDRDGWLNWLIAELVEPSLGQDRPEFVYDYPASQAALAQVRQGPPAVAERFELYFHGVELCNGYHELTDPVELRARITREWTVRFGEAPLNSRLLQAMEAGFPACSGVALGVDRLLMLILGLTQLEDVLPFPIERA